MRISISSVASYKANDKLQLRWGFVAIRSFVRMKRIVISLLILWPKIIVMIRNLLLITMLRVI